MGVSELIRRSGDDPFAITICFFGTPVYIASFAVCFWCALTLI